ncbi:hypothetical protein FDK12_07755 [Arthrobacter sp. NamB2]|uniref:hypothetical protein n=1 Tax=Arthrobacter sp. NamB2 TaxID=2576035 RepID=UPI0010CA06CB|nr:hypothetical protein [Arthrobacter sp. NamB2]TKV28546.1 hypothetical protein FDK12_07755 [Arthrobacter sp. NamB2]
MAVITATGVTATIFEHARKFSEDPRYCRARGWFFLLGGISGALVVPAMLIQQGSPSPLTGYVVGLFFPLIAGFIFLWRAARGVSNITSSRQPNVGSGYTEEDLKLLKRVKLDEAAAEKRFDDPARQTWPS